MVLLTIPERGALSKYNNKEFTQSNNKDFLLSKGNVTSATATTITLPSGADNEYDNLVIEIVNGKGKNQARLITSFTALVATIDNIWDVIPDSNSEYIIHIHSGILPLQDQDNSLETIKLSSNVSSIDGFYNRTYIRILEGDGKNQIAEIITYNGTHKIAKVTPSWNELLSDNSLYAIYGESGISPNGGNDINHIILDGNQSIIIGQHHYIQIYDGTGIGQIREISSITADIIEVSEDWTIIPDNTSKYTIFGGWAPSIHENIVKHTIITLACNIDYLNGQRIIILVNSSMDEAGLYNIQKISELSLNLPTPAHAYTVITKYFRVKIINMGNTLEGYIQTIINSYKSGKLTASLEETIANTDDCELSRSVITGKTSKGHYRNISSTYEGFLQMSIENPLDSFGSLMTTQPQQYIELLFLNNFINPLKTKSFTRNGAIIFSEYNLLNVSTGTNTAGKAELKTSRRIRYVPGLGVLIRFTAIFSEPSADSIQIVGLGNSEDGVFIGYNGLNFGILHRKSGETEIRKLTITETSVANDTITITLNGNTSSGINILSTDSEQQIARKISNEVNKFLDLGDGWDVYEDGASIIFISKVASLKNGTYSYNIGTSNSTGSFTQIKAGETSENNWIYQDNWNRDRAKGLQNLSYVKWDKGNVFEINLQWLGFGNILFKIEDSYSGKFVPIHNMKFAGSLTTTTLETPNLPICICVDKQNGTNTNDVIIKTASLGVFITGNYNKLEGNRFGIHNYYSIANGNLTANTMYNILTIRNNVLFNNLENISTKYLLSVSLGLNTDFNRGGIFTFYMSPTIDNTNNITWNEISNISSMSYSKDIYEISGGIELITHFATPSNSLFQLTTDVEVYIPPGESMTIGFMPFINMTNTSNYADIMVSCAWIDR